MISTRQILGPARLPQRRGRRTASGANGQAAAEQKQKPFPGSAARTALGEQLSASLRESLVEQLAGISSAEEAAAWVHRNLPAKNSLTAPDAKIVEEKFRARLSSFSDGEAAASSVPRGTSDNLVHSLPPGSAGPAALAPDSAAVASGPKGTRR